MVHISFYFQQQQPYVIKYADFVYMLTCYLLDICNRKIGF